MTISIIVAMSLNQVIGAANRLPWRLPNDSARFKELTLGHNVIVGRKTYENVLGYVGQPSPERVTIVVTRSNLTPQPHVKFARSFEEALTLSEGHEVFIVGGAQIYKQALIVAHKIYLTKVHTTLEGDSYFPIFDKSQWQTTWQEQHPADDRHSFAYSFITLERK